MIPKKMPYNSLEAIIQKLCDADLNDPRRKYFTIEDLEALRIEADNLEAHYRLINN